MHERELARRRAAGEVVTVTNLDMRTASLDELRAWQAEAVASYERTQRTYAEADDALRARIDAARAESARREAEWRAFDRALHSWSVKTRLVPARILTPNSAPRAPRAHRSIRRAASTASATAGDDSGSSESDPPSSGADSGADSPSKLDPAALALIALQRRSGVSVLA